VVKFLQMMSTIKINKVADITSKKIQFVFKGKLREFQIYFIKILLQFYINKNFWWFQFFLIRLGCRKI